MRLPPLNTLPIFESAARLESFNKAASEHCISPTSVTRFIKILENHLGFSLFKRHANGVSITEKGKEYYLEIHDCLKIIETNTEKVKSKNREQLKISATPAIAETWLTNSLWSFQKENKDIDIILSFDKLKDPNPDDALLRNDVWLGTMSADSSKHRTTKLIAKGELLLLGSPTIMKRLHQEGSVKDMPFLIDKDWENDWVDWLICNNFDIGLLNKNKKLNNYFDRYSMVVNAAISGEGLMIGHKVLIKKYLDMGLLVRSSYYEDAITKNSFYAVMKEEDSIPIKKFLGWLGTKDII